MSEKKFIPALGRDFLTPFYDPLQRWLVREKFLKGRLIEQANIADGSRVLDLGCGTGTLAILIKEVHPQAEVVGLDADPKVLAIAQKKAAQKRVRITFQQGLAFELPYPPDFFDRVLTSLMLHHLTTEDKKQTLREVWRVLKPGGELHVLDFGKPHNTLALLISLVIRRLEETGDLIQGCLPRMMRYAGFQDAAETTTFMSFFGTLALYRAGKV